VALNPGPHFTRFVGWAVGGGRGRGHTAPPPPEGPNLTQVMTSPADRGVTAVAETRECHGAHQYHTKVTEGVTGVSTAAYSTMSEIAEVFAWGTSNVT
jgi:hypothetical protein